MLKEAMKLKRSGYMPDVIVLEWTNIVLEIEKIKAIFPDAKYVASEHDVSFWVIRESTIQHQIIIESVRSLRMKI